MVRTVAAIEVDKRALLINSYGVSETGRQAITVNSFLEVDVSGFKI